MALSLSKMLSLPQQGARNDAWQEQGQQSWALEHSTSTPYILVSTPKWPTLLGLSPFSLFQRHHQQALMEGRALTHAHGVKQGQGTVCLDPHAHLSSQ